MLSSPSHNTAIALAYPPAIAETCQLVAPSWPLDTAIAVNPWWSLRHQKFNQVAADLETLGRIKCLMPKSFYHGHWGTSIKPEHLVSAARELSFPEDTNALVAYLDEDDTPSPHWHNISDLLDALSEHPRKMSWRDEITQQISQFCGLYFQHPIHIRSTLDQPDQFYRAWLSVARKDRGIQVLMGEKGLHQKFTQLPDCPKILCATVMKEFGDAVNFDDYVHALLIDIHGWSSFLSYKNWQDNFTNTSNALIEQLVSIRLAWDWVLWQQIGQGDPAVYAQLSGRFITQFEEIDSFKVSHRKQQKALWVWQKALEISYQSKLQAQIHSVTVSQVDSPPALQAVFCIDVRSEPMRRALEAQHSDIQTLGFAGFFGLPLEYSFTDSVYRRPQLPGLLYPTIQATQKDRAKTAQTKMRKLRFSQHQKEAFDAAPASLGLVEMFGIFKAAELLKSSFWPANPRQAINELCDDSPFELSRDGDPLYLDQKIDLTVGILTGMGLRNVFAPVVLLLGHGSCTANNPQAAGLDCGACGGQTGEVNVKVLAQLLNDVSIRVGLKSRGINIPEHTQFVAGLHNTTTDKIVCYGEPVPNSLQNWLAAATARAQIQRAGKLGVNIDGDVASQYRQRSQDWAQVRPEWGLADNAAFIVAPRALTRSLDLEGRSFLHDYDWRSDKQFSVLELIMTAPMIVTNWINLQYYASVTDNLIYGSGNKLLHNVVADHIGVFEGNGGDLRIGLSLQSLHDGQNWRHTPLRLNVYIAAPQSAIADIVEKHEMIAQLIDNDWLYLFQVDVETKDITRYYQSNWCPIEYGKIQSETI